MTASFATEVVESGDSVSARGMAVNSVVAGCRGLQSPAASATPGIDPASRKSIQSSADVYARRFLLRICLPAPQIQHGTASEVDR